MIPDHEHNYTVARKRRAWELVRNAPADSGSEVVVMDGLTEAQVAALRNICERYRVKYDPAHYTPQFDLPTGYVGGWVGGPEHGQIRTVEGEWVRTSRTTIYIGCDAEGRISS